MRRLSVQITLGVLVLAAGVLLLLEATGIVGIPRLLWAVLLAAASVAFWYVFFTHRPSWWAAIVGAALAGAAIVTVMELDVGGLGQWTEVPFLAALSVGFWAVYFRDHDRWWALIPAGVLLTLSVVSAVTAAVGGPVTGAIFLLGVAFTFVLVAVLPGGAGRRWWAWIPAGILGVVAVIVLFNAAEWYVVLNYLWPVAVIGAGAYLIWRAVCKSRRHRDRQPASTELTSTEGTPPEDATQ
jgi:hypothetical protein